jgi:hypothetical protein
VVVVGAIDRRRQEVRHGESGSKGHGDGGWVGRRRSVVVVDGGR